MSIYNSNNTNKPFIQPNMNKFTKPSSTIMNNKISNIKMTLDLNKLDHKGNNHNQQGVNYPYTTTNNAFIKNKAISPINTTNINMLNNLDIKSPEGKISPGIFIDELEGMDMNQGDNKVYPQTSKNNKFHKFKTSQVQNEKLVVSNRLNDEGSPKEAKQSFFKSANLAKKPEQKLKKAPSLTLTLQTISNVTSQERLNSPIGPNSAKDHQLLYDPLLRKDSNSRDNVIDKQKNPTYDISNIIQLNDKESKKSPSIPIQYTFSNFLNDGGMSNEQAKISKMNINTNEKNSMVKEHSMQFKELNNLLLEKSNEINKLNTEKQLLKTTIDDLSNEVKDIKTMKIILKDKEKLADIIHSSINEALLESQQLKKQLFADGNLDINEIDLGKSYGGMIISINDQSQAKSYIQPYSATQFQLYQQLHSHSHSQPQVQPLSPTQILSYPQLFSQLQSYHQFRSNSYSQFQQQQQQQQQQQSATSNESDDILDNRIKSRVYTMNIMNKNPIPARVNKEVCQQSHIDQHDEKNTSPIHQFLNRKLSTTLEDALNKKLIESPYYDSIRNDLKKAASKTKSIKSNQSSSSFFSSNKKLKQGLGTGGSNANGTSGISGAGNSSNILKKPDNLQGEILLRVASGGGGSRGDSAGSPGSASGGINRNRITSNVLNKGTATSNATIATTTATGGGQTGYNGFLRRKYSHDTKITQDSHLYTPSFFHKKYSANIVNVDEFKEYNYLTATNSTNNTNKIDVTNNNKPEKSILTIAVSPQFKDKNDAQTDIANGLNELRERIKNLLSKYKYNYDKLKKFNKIFCEKLEALNQNSQYSLLIKPFLMIISSMITLYQ